METELSRDLRRLHINTERFEAVFSELLGPAANQITYIRGKLNQFWKLQAQSNFSYSKLVTLDSQPSPIILI
jgi:hypothetical protein